jgi:quercetin dioxygenase-like cupin family protein
MRRLLTTVFALGALTACPPEEPRIVVPPPTSAHESVSSLPPESIQKTEAPDASADAAPKVLAPPVLAKMLEVTKSGTTLRVGSPCDVFFVAIARGAVTVAGQSLSKGDVLRASFPSDVEMTGSGLAVIITSIHECAKDSPAPGAALHIARSGDAKELTWAGGAMHARLDLEKDVSPDVYVGRLEGTAPVAEHDHATSWEILCALEGSGIFTLDGVATHLVAPTVVAVPPGRKHAWQPDAGTKLVAVQVYAPPGPEQRFKALAAGAPKSAPH